MKCHSLGWTAVTCAYDRLLRYTGVMKGLGSSQVKGDETSGLIGVRNEL